MERVTFQVTMSSEVVDLIDDEAERLGESLQLRVKGKLRSAVLAQLAKEHLPARAPAAAVRQIPKRARRSASPKKNARSAAEEIRGSKAGAA